MENTNQKYSKKKSFRGIIILLVLILLDFICAKSFIPKNNLYNDFRTEHSYYHHSLIPFQSCITNINIQNERHANILNVPYIESDDYLVKTNSLGFIDKSMRNVEDTTDKERIVFIGGSFVEGYGCEFDSTFTGILIDKYDNNQIEILNAGVIAYSPKLVYLKTKFLLEVQKIKINKLVVFANTFEIADELIYESFKPVINKADLRHSKIKNKIKNIISRNSFLYFALSEIYNGRNFLQDPSKPAETVPLMEEIWPTKDHFIKERIYWEFSPYFEKWGKRGFNLAKENTKALFELCKEHNIEVVAVCHPIFEEILDDHRECLYVKMWEDYCNEYNASFLNLYPVFMNSKKTAQEVVDEYYITGDGHWNEKGHKLVARFLYQNINLN